MPPTAEQLLKQAIRLARAPFDMRCADAMAQALIDRHDDHGPSAYGLLTGMVVPYARPFTESDEYGRLGGKWTRFEGKPHLKAHHDKLLDHRRALLAHNDLTEHRATVIWTRGAWHEDRPAHFEARSPINAPGIVEARELFRYQRERFDAGLGELLAQLQGMLGWPDGREVDLGFELERVSKGQTPEEFYATPRRRPELPQP
jgi:hypothetical protein